VYICGEVPLVEEAPEGLGLNAKVRHQIGAIVRFHPSSQRKEEKRSGPSKTHGWDSRLTRLIPAVHAWKAALLGLNRTTCHAVLSFLLERLDSFN
jgi:hypothetical protein